MPASEAEILVGRRYLDRGFLDAAMKIFLRNAELVSAEDWRALSDRLMERNRIADVVRVCEMGGVPLPRERMLALADMHLRRKDLDAAIRLYELADADREHWARVVDLLTAVPERQRLALELAERHLCPDDDAEPPLSAAPGRQMTAVR